MYIRKVGNNSFALTFELGVTADEILSQLTAELTRKVDGVSVYGYDLGEYSEYKGGGHDFRMQYLLGTGADGAAKRVAIKYWNGQLALAQGTMTLRPNGRMTYQAGWSVSRNNQYNITVVGLQSRLTLYVFAAPNWLVIYPRVYSNVSKLPAHINADGALCVFDLDSGMTQKYSGIYNSLACQLAYFSGIHVLGGSSFTDYAGDYNVSRNYKPSFMVQTLSYNNYNDPDRIYDSAEGNEWEFSQYGPNNIMVSCNGHQMSSTFPEYFAGPGVCSTVRVMQNAYNYWYDRFVAGNQVERQPRRVFGIKSFEPNATMNVLDKIDIKCDAQGFIDKSGVDREHVIIRGYAPHTPNGTNQFFYAIPS